MFSPNRSPLSAFALLLFSTPAHSAGFCPSLPDLHKRVNFCDDNYNYVAPAEECLESYRAHVKAKNAEIRSLLEANQARSNGHTQKQQFEITKEAYKTTDEILAELIALGLQVHAELLAYEHDFVPPETPWMRPRSAFDYVHDPKHRQEFLELEGCYAAPIVKVDSAMDEVSKMLGELRSTRKDTAQLQKGVSSRDDKLGMLAETTPLGGARVVKGGRSPRSHSDITGTADPRRRDSVLELAGTSAPATRKIASLGRQSDPSLPAPEKLLFAQEHLNGTTAFEKAAADFTASISGLGPEAESGESSAPEGKTSATGNENPIPINEAGMALVEHEPEVKLLSQVELAELLQSELGRQGELVSNLASEESLFARVHKRYRASGLFPYP